jgi:hypothetical protein
MSLLMLMLVYSIWHIAQGLAGLTVMSLLLLLRVCSSAQRAWRSLLVQREAKRHQAAALIQRCWRARRVAQADEWMRQFLVNCLEACRALKQAR